MLYRPSIITRRALVAGAAAGDVLGFSVTSATTIQRVTVSLTCVKS